MSLCAVVLFLDGVGLGEDNPTINPLATARMPVLSGLLAGSRLLASAGRVSTAAATLVPTDASLSVPGRPQSATGQTALLTGRNAAALLGEHYGPKPDARLRQMLQQDTLFSRLLATGRSVCYANAFPASYFAAVKRGKRLPGAIPQAVLAAGLALRTAADLAVGQALSVDFTNAAWRDGLGYPDIPLLTPFDAGLNLARLARHHHLTFFEHWATDLVGHRRDLPGAVALLEAFDAFLGGLLTLMDLHTTLVVVTSDHGNVEDCSQRNHTTNPVPTVLIGRHHQAVAEGIRDLTDVAPALLAWLGQT